MNVNWFIRVKAPITKSIVCFESHNQTQLMCTSIGSQFAGVSSKFSRIPQMDSQATVLVLSIELSMLSVVSNSKRAQQTTIWQLFPWNLVSSKISGINVLNNVLSLTGYICSVFCHSHPNLNRLALTIKVPPLPSLEQGTKTLEHNSFMQSPTITKVLNYLKHILEMEYHSQHNPVLKAMTAPDVQSSYPCLNLWSSLPSFPIQPHSKTSLPIRLCLGLIPFSISDIHFTALNLN